jgi:quinol monooxygenase YgiN
MRAQPGFLFAYLYQDMAQDTTDCISITAWQERINFDVFMGSASYKEYAEKVRPFIDTEMPRRSYDLAAGGEKT